MMSVKEYAADTGNSVAEILKKCSELGINATGADYDLSEDTVVTENLVVN